MKIREITMKQFKRFTDLTITGLSSAIKLVVLLGPNGCGKTSVFDAINYYVMQQSTTDRSSANLRRIRRIGRIGSRPNNAMYYFKNYNRHNQSGEAADSTKVQVRFHGKPRARRLIDWSRVMYGRSAYRDPQTDSIGAIRFDIPEAWEESGISRFSELDRATNASYLHLVNQTMSQVFEKADPKTTIEQLRSGSVGEINRVLNTIFPGITLKGTSNPSDRFNTFIFDKPYSSDVILDNLSGGEKAAFDLILDLSVRRSVFDDSVYCIDEPEAHLSTRLQTELLEAMYNIVPEKCQLWIATHSIGMMRKAYDLQNEYPNTVAFLDFNENIDFNTQQTLRPIVPNANYWRATYSIALDDLASLIAPKRIFVCEGDKGEMGFDAACYNRIFGEELHDTLFVSAGSNSEVVAIAAAIQKIVQGAEVIPLIDRNSKTDIERNDAINAGNRVLGRYALENYLLDDEVLRKFALQMKQRQLFTRLKSARNAKNKNLHLKPAKDAATGVYATVKKICTNVFPGEGWKAMLRDNLAPLVTPDTKVYKELKADIAESI